jgi:hypothetical protein
MMSMLIALFVASAAGFAAPSCSARISQPRPCRVRPLVASAEAEESDEERRARFEKMGCAPDRESCKLPPKAVHPRPIFRICEACIPVADTEWDVHPRGRREAAAEQAKLDSVGDDGGLMAEFNKKLDDEGGATMFKLKTGASQASESAGEAASKVTRAGEDLKDTADGWVAGLTEQQRKIGTIVLGLIAFNLLISTLMNVLR